MQNAQVTQLESALAIKQARPMDVVLTEWRSRVLTQGGSEGEHYALRKIELLEEELSRVRAALRCLDDLNNPCAECGCHAGHLSGCSIGIARWGKASYSNGARAELQDE